MPGTHTSAAATAAAVTSSTAPLPPRRAASVVVPVTATRLASDFRPTKTRSTLTRRSDGLYIEPYSAIVERDDEVSVLCVQRTEHGQVLVRHMPEREWRRIVRHGEEVHPGREGESSLHVVAPPGMSTLPRSLQAERRAAQNNGEDSNAAALTTAEPVVFDYVVAPESRTAKLEAHYKSVGFTALRLHARYKKSDLQRVAREDCRAMLAVERRNIFLRQYQRDVQARMTGTPLYTVGKHLPDRLIQTFFMQVENTQALLRHEARVNARARGQQDEPRQLQQQRGGPYLFTLVQAYTSNREPMPFAGQAPADGYVVVTVGPTADAFTTAWRPWSAAGRFAWLMDDENDNKPFVPYDYGNAEYLPRPTATEAAEHRPCSSPLLPRIPDRKASKKVSTLSSNAGTSPLDLSRAPSSPAFGAVQVGGTAHHAAAQGNRTATDARDSSTRTPSPLRLPLSSDEGEDDNSAELGLMSHHATVTVA